MRPNLSLFHGLAARFTVLTVFSLVVQSCSTEGRASYDAADASIARLEGFGTVRSFAGSPAIGFPDAKEWVTATPGPDVHVLALSGGGSGGAFAVGVLSVWTRKGDRPSFEVVTGVSTGALIAPFAFLGAACDQELADLYVGGEADRLVDFDWKTAGVFGASLLKGRALQTAVDAHVTPDVLQKVAAEHRKGRRLFVVTTDLDTQQAVIWNMGAIAASNRADALILFRKVLIASASIPGVFPAVMIKANVGNRVIEEMHSDGGSSMQFFTLPDYLLSNPTNKLPAQKKFHFFVIVNNALIPEFKNVNNKALSVVGRAYSVLVKSQAQQELLTLYNYAQRSHSEFKFAAIDEQIPYSPLDPFNETYMQKVFMRGYFRTLDGALWNERPTFR